MAESEVGLERRYEIERINDPEGKHSRCLMFVMDPEHDVYARGALRHYASAVKHKYPQLAKDLNEWMDRYTYAE